MNIASLKDNLLKDVLSSSYADRKIIFGEGSENAKIFMIGEAPGGDEEKQGRPFVGKAGKNLNEFLNIVGLERKDIYISNVVKIRPFSLSNKTGNPVNRTPNKTEIKFFSPYLMKEIEIIKPDIIVTLGNVPLRTVLENDKINIGDYHGKITQYKNNKIFALYHPAAIIYNSKLKETYYNDLNNLKNILFN